jgi:pyruvate dehydrogenase E2 component (dihydrolipoamide acetyltransferase)
VLRIAAGGPKDGDTVAVGTLLGRLETTGETTPTHATADAAAPLREPRRDVQALNVAAPQPQPVAGRQAISPRARRAARERGIDATQVQGSGRHGRIREGDILAAAAAAAGRPLSPVRRAIAERMVQSLRNTAPVTLTTTAHATNLVKLRNQFKSAPHGPDSIVPSITDLFVKIAAHALQQHPALNACWQDDRIVTSAQIHIGIAVDTEAGLLAPVIRNVPALTLEQIARQTRALADKARRRQLTAEEMQGGTFTITNLGAFGIDAFTPIINWPQCAILGIGRIRRQPAVIGDQVVAREQVTLSLTFDHRLVDGAPAGRFLQTLCSNIEAAERQINP